MKTELLMPQMGESITEGTIAKWLKNPGDSVQEGEVVLEISTDKVDSEVTAPVSGVLSEALFKVGDVVPVKTVIAVIDSSANPSKPKGASDQSKEPIGAVPTAGPVKEGASAAAGVTPLARSIAKDKGVSEKDLGKIPGSGAGGKITKNDLAGFLEKGASSTPAPKSVSSGNLKNKDEVSTLQKEALSRAITPLAQIAWGDNDVVVSPLDGMRQAIAEHMVRSKITSPHVYSVQEVDVSVISKWRKQKQGEFEKQEGFKLSFTPFFLQAAVLAIQEFPIVNSSLSGKELIYKRHINLGCAVALGDTGLIVPVIKRAEEKNFVGLARSLNDLALRARSKKLLPDDVSGGTFTVTNPGIFGTMIGTPIINQPQVAILCLGAIHKRPVVIDDMIAIREMCYLTLSYDHRVIDGAISGQFLSFIKKYLQGWDLETTI